MAFYSHRRLANHYGALVLCFLTGASCAAVVDGTPSERAYSLHSSIARLLNADRPFKARLSGSVGWAKCEDPIGIRSSGEFTCSSYHPNAARLANAAQLIASSLPAGAPHELDKVWADALVDLASDPTANQVDAIIERLTTFVADDPENSGAHNDLAIAHMVRYAKRHDAVSAFNALDQIERARRADTTSATVAFNRALILETLGLPEAAGDEWARALAQEPAIGWQDEAHSHRDALRRSTREQTAGVDERNGRAEPARDPQGAREWVLNQALSRWAVLAEQHARAGADSTAQSISAIASALTAKSGDSSMQHVAADLVAADVRTVQAMSAFAAGARQYGHGDYALAAPVLTAASRRLRLARRNAVADWVEVMIAGIDIARSDFATAASRCAAVESGARRRQDISLRARALWIMGLAAARQGKAAEAVDLYNESGQLFMHLDESTNAGSMLSQGADVMFLLGRDDAALDYKLRALAALAVHPKPTTRVGPLMALGRQLDDVGLAYAGLAVLEEATRTASHSSRAPDHAEALIRLGAAQFTLGAEDAGHATLARARMAMGTVSDPFMHDRLEMELAAAEAGAGTGGPRRAIARLDEVATFFRRRHILFDLVSPLSRAARLRLQLGDTAAAEVNLTEAVATIEAQRLKATDPASARDIAMSRRDAFGELVAIRLARSDTSGAFLLAEHARGNRIRRAPRVASGRLVIAQTTLADRTVLWIASGSSLRMVRVAATSSHLTRLVDKIEREMRSGRGSNQELNPARQLYDLLIGPAEPELKHATELVIVADDKLGRIPYAALRGPDGQFLVQRAAISYATAVRNQTRAKTVHQLLVLGNPTYDSSLFPDLSPLKAAGLEARDVQAVHGRAVLLAREAATKPALVSALRTADGLHFAGHARLVERAPLLSHLVLARQDGGLAANVLSASEIQRMDLRHLGLVLLSSCGTTQPLTRRSGSENGLASAFLAAGAGAVVSSTWEADDEGTAALMVQLHQRLARGIPPVTALREAQLALIASSSPYAAPHVWGAFRIDTR